MSLDERMIGTYGPLRLADGGNLAHASYVAVQIRNGEWVQDAAPDPITRSTVRYFFAFSLMCSVAKPPHRARRTARPRYW